ncbi:ABC transporter substrate-binding protein [Salinifilum aidingensis]
MAAHGNGGPWNRRRLLTTALGAAAAVPLAGCGPGGPGGAGERIRAGFPTAGATESLDPHTSSMFVDQARAKALFDRLVGYDDDMRLVPRLAESWEPDATGRRWRVRLRRARFHDGRPVTAADVLYSYRRIADPATASPARSGFRGVDFTASRDSSQRELELVLHEPNFEFPVAWGGPAAEIVPEGSTDFSAPIGSGPFRLRSFEPNSSAVLTAFSGHWTGEPAPAELEFVSLDEESARVNALLSGQIHYAPDVTANSATLLERDRRTGVLAAPGATMQAVSLKVDRPPFSDRRLVRAIQLGVDRRQLVETVLSGRGELGDDLFGRGLQYYPQGLRQRHHDPQRARALLRAGGMRNPAFPLDTSTADPYFQRAATLISEQLGGIGVEAAPRQRSAEAYYSEITEHGVAAHVRTAALPIVTYLAERVLSGGTESSYTGYASPEFDAVFRRALRTADEAERARLLGEAQRRARDDSGMLVWGFSDYNVGVSSALRGMRAAPPNSLDWARFDRAHLS